MPPENCSKYSVKKIITVTYLLIMTISVSARRKVERGKVSNSIYYPIDTGYVSELNDLRCANYTSHLAGKSRWPFSCLLPASHLATGRVLDGTSSLPERRLAPPWLNLTLFNEGQKFAKSHSGHLLLSHIYGLFCTNLFKDTFEVLLFTGEFDSPVKATQCYTRIANGIFSWYRNSPEIQDLPTFSQVAKKIRDVRRIHRNVTKQANRKLHNKRLPNFSLIDPSAFKSRTVNEVLWADFKSDVSSSPIPLENRALPIEYFLLEEHKRPLNQFIQALTQFGFVGIPILFPEQVGLNEATDDELFAFNHLWAVVGYCIGIRDEFNISLQPDLPTARSYFRDIFETFIVPAFFRVDIYAKLLIDPLLVGVNILEASMTPGIVVTRILRDILGIPVPNMIKYLKSREKSTLEDTDALIRSNLNASRLLVTMLGESVLRTRLVIEDSPQKENITGKLT